MECFFGLAAGESWLPGVLPCPFQMGCNCRRLCLISLTNDPGLQSFHDLTTYTNSVFLACATTSGAVVEPAASEPAGTTGTSNTDSTDTDDFTGATGSDGDYAGSSGGVVIDAYAAWLDIDFRGGDIGTVPGDFPLCLSSVDECATACLDNPDCYSWWVPLWILVV